MASLRAIQVARSCVARSQVINRELHQSAARRAITSMQMPAMSPTMTEGGITSWKKQEGDAFSAGDVLLEIETDKATIDVEAQDDGVMGKILVPDGAKGIQVGKIIALLAEEGDDISNLEIPKEEAVPPPKEEKASVAHPPPPVEHSPSQPSASTSNSQSPAHPTHSKPLFPSVHRLLAENGIADAEKIKGTGVRGMLTKGDVLAYLGKASSPTGTFKEASSQEAKPATSTPVKKEAPLDGPAIRRLIVSTMLKTSIKARSAPAFATEFDFDSVIADYLPPTPASKPASIRTTDAKTKTGDFLDGLI